MADRIILKNANVNGSLTDVTVLGGKIEQVGKTEAEGRVIDIKGAKLFAGLVDIHTHGANGLDTMDSDVYELASFMKKSGTTSFLATTMTDSEEKIAKVTNVSLEYRDGCANIMGFHLEGPYISEKYKGAQYAEYIKDPDAKRLLEFKNAAMITVAPELNGAMEFIESAHKHGIKISLGHTDADFATSDKAMKQGACCLTHTFNAMPPLHHRETGPIGAAIMNHSYVQVICDGEHIHQAAILALYRIFGSDRMILISDSMRARGLGDGEYCFGGQRITVKEGVARTEHGALAGSTASLLDCVRRAIEFGIPESDAFKMASYTPAALMGWKKGRIEAGYDAEFIVTDENYRLLDTIILK